MDDPYVANIVKKYEHWTVYLHQDQGYLGRCVIDCNRADAREFLDATPEEHTELFAIIKDLQEAIRTSFGASWFNYAFLGNVDRHLHCHLIPRYDHRVTFADTTFTDLNFNANPYKTGTTKFASPEVHEAIRAELAKVL